MEDKTEKNRTIGIVGGMGPWAGIDLAQHITRMTQSKGDQQHHDFVMMSFPGSITDRTSFIENTEALNPAHSISAIIHKLEMMGAEVVGMACNSSHVPEIYDVVIDELKKMNSSVQMVHMPRETCRFIREEYPLAKRVGVMSTNGTYNAGLYEDLLNDMGFEVILPNEGFQRNVIHEMIYSPIYGIKSTGDLILPRLKRLLYQALDF
ncbi:MAG: amino acid racemase, partial [Bacteroidota bacterium]